MNHHSLFANFLLLLLLLFFGSTLSVHNLEIAKVNQPPARRSLLSFPDNHDTVLVAALDGTIHLAYRDSGKIIWSFASGAPIYSSYQAPINHDDNKDGAFVSGGNFYIDCDDEWKLFAHAGPNIEPKHISMEQFIRDMPHVSEDGGVLLGSKKTTAFVVDANTGKLIRVHHSSPDTKHISSTNDTSKPIVKKSVMKNEKPVKQLSFTRTDYLLTSIAGNSDKVLWNLTVADIDVALFCQENPKSVNGPSLSLHNDLRSKSGDSFNLPLKCESKEAVHRLRTPLLLETFKMLDRQPEHRIPLMLLPSNDPKTPNIKTQTVFSLPNNEQNPDIPGPQDVTKPVLTERRIAFIIISVLIIAIGVLMYRHHTFKAAMMNKQPDVLNAKSSSSRRRRNRKSAKNFGNEDGNTEVEIEKRLPLSFNHLIECDMEGRSIGKLFVSTKEIAKGSNGTIVLEGIYEGRKVAVKRLVRAHHDVAFKEIQNLIASDHHPNIVRWYGVEYDHDFVYLSLERCACSLYDLIQIYSESFQKVGCTDAQVVRAMADYKVNLDLINGVMNGNHLWRPNGYPSSIMLKLLRDIVSGLVHLHELGIIHRDLKPHNVLIVQDKFLCAKLSDMGISRRLVGDMSSLGHHATGCGSSGWQAPEQLLVGRQTRAVDMFSLGCVLFFCITCGRHPFGEPLERDVNVAKNQVNLFLVQHIPEAVDLFTQLLNPNSELRPKASEVLHHPLFWDAETRMSFLRDASDRVELEDREVDSIILRALENTAPIALGGKWDEKMEPAFITNIGHYRRYKYNSVRDLLRVIRNKLNHYRELPVEIQALLGSVPEGFNDYFASRFPKLLMEVYNVMYYYCKEEEWFHKYLVLNL